METYQGKTLLDGIGKEGLKELLSASCLLNSTLEPERVLLALMETANRLLKTEASSLLLVDRREKKLYFKAATGRKAEEVAHFTMPISKGIAGWVIRHRKPYMANDVQSDPHWAKDIAQKLNFPTRSVLCVPITHRGQLIGAIEVINKEKAGEFDDLDVAMLSTLANQAALAVINARVYEEVESDKEKLISDLIEENALIGTSREIRRLRETIQKVAHTDSTILLRGESGTGKELIAKAIHFNSPRRGKPFTCVNCNLFSETLLESELFGHEEGAFTGAIKRRIGRFEQADQGTVFLDEIGSISPEAQLKLLRVLQDREFERLGGSETIKVDVRVIAATNEDLEAALERGRFREDLYYRLKVIEIFVQPLREKKEDIPGLVDFFLKEQVKKVGRAVRGVSSEAMELLAAYDWPGNIRELRNSVERAVVLGSGDTLLPEHLPLEIRKPARGKKGLTLGDAERQRIVEILDKTGWNKSRAAKILGISRNRLNRKIREYGIS